jgi:curved DNA-binding protein CbpA
MTTFRRLPKRTLGHACQSLNGSIWAGSRGFCSSKPRHDHYATLGVPRNATKSQIKSNFYKLSKQHHPDLSKDPKSPAIFSAIREAYDVLGDDRARRQYDRDRGGSRTTGPTGTHTGSSQTYSRTTETHRGATHAWQWSYTYRSGTSRPQSHSSGAGRTRHPGATSYHYTPPHRKAETFNRNRKESAADRIAKESDFWRATQVIGGVLLVTMLGMKLARG